MLLRNKKVYVKKSKHCKPIQIHHMKIIHDLFRDFSFSCDDDDEDVILLHIASQDADHFGKSSY